LTVQTAVLRLGVLAQHFVLKAAMPNSRGPSTGDGSEAGQVTTSQLRAFVRRDYILLFVDTANDFARGKALVQHSYEKSSDEELA